jgi:hypothetical protein
METDGKIVPYFQVGIFLGFFDKEDGGDTSLRNVGWLSTGYIELCTRGQ